MFLTLQAIGSRFNIPGKLYAFETITNGNVNSTYKVTYIQGENSFSSYIFQKINTTAFHHPEHIMANVDLITTYIHEKFPEEQTLTFYSTDTGLNYCYDESGSFWRVMNYIDSITYNFCEDEKIIEATGKAFGHFAMQLSDFDCSLLYDTIPNFHNTEMRLNKLFLDIEEDSYRRANEVEKEIQFISSVRKEATKLSIEYNNHMLPVRVTHNDTKCNNILFDKLTKEPVAVIDYDTIMPGTVLYDFGDAVRFIANSADEDEPDLSKVSFDENKFKAFCKGYLREIKHSLSEYELSSLVLATFSITIELAARFLDDYLTGDKYFKIDYPKHNLVRTKCQICLANDILNKYDRLNEIIQGELKNE